VCVWKGELTRFQNGRGSAEAMIAFASMGIMVLFKVRAFYGVGDLIDSLH